MQFRILGAVCALLSMNAAANLLDDVMKPQDYEARRASSSNEDLARNGDARAIPQGEELVLMEEQGPGVVTHFWNTIAAFDPFHGRSVVLRVYYDGAQEPSVVSPLGDFFGVGHGAYRDINSMPVCVTSLGRSRTCYWRMPFRESIRITVANESDEYTVDSFYWQINWRKLAELPAGTPYFHARYRQEFPAEPGNYAILETEGKGHYVGTVYSAHQMESGWFGEGDDFFYIDGAAIPQLRGTGTEDYFNDAWGFREFTLPFFGVPVYEGVLSGDRVTAYRWHLADPVPFEKSLRVEIEHKGSIYNDRAPVTSFDLGGFEERKDWVSSVAFWYQDPPATFSGDIGSARDRIAPYRVISAGELVYRADPPLLVVQEGPFLAYLPSTPDASLEIDFELEEDGRYVLAGIFVQGMIGGVYQISLDGKPLGEPHSFVVGQYDPMWLPLETHDLKAGTHTLRFEGVDRTPRGMRALMPKLHGLGCAYLVHLRLQDMAGLFEVRDALMEKRRAQ